MFRRPVITASLILGASSVRGGSAAGSPVRSNSTWKSASVQSVPRRAHTLPRSQSHWGPRTPPPAADRRDAVLTTRPFDDRGEPCATLLSPGAATTSTRTRLKGKTRRPRRCPYLVFGAVDHRWMISRRAVNAPPMNPRPPLHRSADTCVELPPCRNIHHLRASTVLRMPDPSQRRGSAGSASAGKPECRRGRDDFSGRWRRGAARP